MPQLQSSPPLSERLHEIMDTIDRLHPLPLATRRVLSILEDPNATARKIADQIGLDQALTSYVLRLANSAAMGYSVDCASIENAVARLGFKRLRSSVLSFAASGPLTRRFQGYRIGAQDLWNHSVAAATYAAHIARFTRYPEPEEAYVAGLLHDIGKLLLDQFVVKDYTQIVTLMQKHNKHLWEVEEEIFGIDHAGVGSLMAAKWNLPPGLVSAIRCHHIPSLSWNRQKLAAIVNIANALTPRDATSLTGLDGRFINPASLAALQLDQTALERLQHELAAQSQAPQPILVD